MTERATVNLHTHTFRCKHAVGGAMDYARAAAEQGLGVLGITDHTPFPDDRMPNIRMPMAELNDYLCDVRAAQAAYPQLRVLSGLECEYFPELDDYYRWLLQEKKLDYLIGSVHVYSVRGSMQGFWNGFHMDSEAYDCYANAYIQMLQSGHFRFGAHPDLYGACTDIWNADSDACAEQICAAAAWLDIPLEINVSGWLKQEQAANRLGYTSAAEAEAAGHLCARAYPQEAFWRIAARYSVKAVINSDAHDPAVLTRYMDLGYDLARRCSVEIVYPFGQ